MASVERREFLPGPDLLAAVRACLMLRHQTLTDAARRHGVTLQPLRQALLGGWRGPKAARIVQALAKELGLRIGNNNHPGSPNAKAQTVR